MGGGGWKGGQGASHLGKTLENGGLPRTPRLHARAAGILPSVPPGWIAVKNEIWWYAEFVSVMATMRRHLSCVLGIWLVFQIAGIVAPVGLAAAGFMTADELCDCPADGHGATCPMHHGKTPRPSPANDGSCRFQNTCAPADATLLSMLTGAGILTAPAVSVAEDLASEAISPATFHPAQRFELPDAPPPRT